MRDKKNDMNACYKCRFRGAIPGDCHTRCLHPNPESNNVKGEKHGIANGWFWYPFNFDPVWLINCDGFEEKNGEEGEKNGKM